MNHQFLLTVLLARVGAGFWLSYCQSFQGEKVFSELTRWYVGHFDVGLEFSIALVKMLLNRGTISRVLSDRGGLVMGTLPDVPIVTSGTFDFVKFSTLHEQCDRCIQCVHARHHFPHGQYGLYYVCPSVCPDIVRTCGWVLSWVFVGCFHLIFWGICWWSLWCSWSNVQWTRRIMVPFKIAEDLIQSPFEGCPCWGGVVDPKNAAYHKTFCIASEQ